MVVLVTALVAGACQGDDGTATTVIVPTDSVATTTTSTLVTTTASTTTTTTEPPPAPPPSIAWEAPEAILAMGPWFLTNEGDLATAAVTVIVPWDGALHLLTRVDLTGRSRDLGGVAQTDAYTNTRVWSSPDGSGWIEGAPLPFPGASDEWASSATVFRGDLVVGGAWKESGTEATQVQGIWMFTEDDSDGAVWIAEASGDTWRRVPDPALGGEREEEIRAIAVIADRLVAVGSTQLIPSFGEMVFPEYDATVWTSDDAVSWRQVPDPSGVFSGPGIETAMDAVVSDGTRLWAFGIDDRGSADVLAVWTSADGEIWERVETTGDGLSSQLGLVVAAVAHSPAGWVVVGNEFGDGRHPAIWFSADGYGWERVPPPTDLDGELLGVVATDAGFVAVGFTRADSVTQTLVAVSGDGRAWYEHTDDTFEVPGMAEGTLSAIGTHEGLVVISGSVTYADDFREVLVWSGRIAAG
jgi:hypothetical protein